MFSDLITNFRTDAQGPDFAAGGHTGAIKALESAGASVDKQADHHATPLDLAAFQGHTEAVKALADELAVKALLDEL